MTGGLQTAWGGKYRVPLLKQTANQTAAPTLLSVLTGLV
ncbi:Uncharacterised protein [Neisseria animalis]|nr:Uncharacterised protein [Neisseria animalis]